jgi:hypothetical protein
MQLSSCIHSYLQRRGSTAASVLIAVLLSAACKKSAEPSEIAQTGVEPPHAEASLHQKPPAPSSAAQPESSSALPQEDPCATICRQTAPLGCSNAKTCLESCRETRDVRACRREMAEVLRCLTRQPLAHWECDPEGEAAIKDGYCDQQQGTFAGCLSKAVGHGGM